MLDALRDVVQVTRLYSLPLAISVTIALLLCLPSQIIEYYRILTWNLVRPSGMRGLARGAVEIAQALLAVGAMGYCTSLSAKWLRAEARTNVTLRTGFWCKAIDIVPVFIALLPLLGLLLGLIEASASRTAIGKILALQGLVAQSGPANLSNGLSALLKSADWFYYVLYVAEAVIVATAVATVIWADKIGLKPRADDAPPWWLGTRAGVGAFAAATALMILVFTLSRVALPQALGLFTILAIFTICLTGLATQFNIVARRTQIPINVCLVAYAVLLSITNLNDNHGLRRIESKGKETSAEPAVAPLTKAGEAFLKWYEARPEKDEIAAYGKYPVFIVAAQGGGVTTAAQTLTFLTRLQMACPRFAQHLFAISSVSGGSVGAAYYSVLADSYLEEKIADEKCPPLLPVAPKPDDRSLCAMLSAYQFVQTDFLSPLVAAALFPDFLQRFIFWPIASLSRARALEQALEEGWYTSTQYVLDRQPKTCAHLENQLNAETEGSNPLAQGLVSGWWKTDVTDPSGVKPSKTRPALLLNTTEAGSGRRRVIAPFGFDVSKGSDLEFFPISRAYDLPISTAAVTSARFPWVTPAAWFRDPTKGGAVSRLVDGGYFENSGVATAIDLINQLRSYTNEKGIGDKFEFHLLALTGGDYPDDRYLGLSEFIAPIQTLLNAWRSRAYTTVDIADRQLGVVADSKEKFSQVRRLQKVQLETLLTPFPLGWRLSFASAFQISLQSGYAEHCRANAALEQTAGGSSADCVRLLVNYLLRNQTPP